MKLTVNWMEHKTVTAVGVPRQIIEGTFIGDNNQEIKATIWREDRDGKIFPGFDELAPGHEFEGNTWLNPKTGKYAIYPPKVASKGNFTPNRGGINAAVDKKNINIREAQDRKEESINKAACQRDAVILVSTFYKDQMLGDEEIKEKIELWRGYLQNKLNQPF